MKIAVLSDVHGNVPALAAVLDDIERWRPDEVIVNGDLVSRGPYSLPCLCLIQSRLPRARYLKGNHETFVLFCADNPAAPDDPRYDLRRFARWSAAQLGDAVEAVRAWDGHVDIDEPGGGSFHVTHGSRLGNRDGIFPHTDDESLARKLGDPRELFVASHTHHPLTRRLNGTLVVNTGSVGQPFDGDPRAAYGRFEFSRGRWRAQIARVAFDRQRAERDFADSGFLDGGGPIARLILTEFRQTRMHMGVWMGRYADAVKAGDISVERAVTDYLSGI